MEDTQVPTCGSRPADTRKGEWRMKYKVTITKTADGKQEYLQVISEDQFSTNIVLIGKFELRDTRKE